MTDVSKDIVPHSVVEHAFRAPLGHKLWFDLLVGSGMDQYSVKVHPTSFTRGVVERTGVDFHIVFSYEAEDEQGNRYAVETRERWTEFDRFGYTSDTFSPESTIEMTPATPPIPRIRRADDAPPAGWSDQQASL